MGELTTKFIRYQPKENHPDWELLFLEAKELASDIAGNIPPKHALQGSLLEKRKIKVINKTLKNFRINKQKMSRQDHNFMPLFYIWTMTNNCNFNCSYCSDHRGNIYPDLYKQGLKKNLSTREGKKLIEIMKESSAIYYCGGEPTLRKDLPDLLEHSTSFDMFNMINTNGSIICDLLLKPGYRLFLHQMDVIIVSLDSLDLNKLAQIYQVNRKTAEKTLRNIITLSILRNHVPFKLVANTVINSDNIEDTFDILDWCNDLGITFSPVSANLGNQPDWELIKNNDYRRLVSLIIERAEQGYPMIASRKALERLLRGTGFYCFPVVFDHIDHDGCLYWPCKAYKKATKVNVLHYGSATEVHRAAGDLVDPTYFHGNDPHQCQGQCAWMQNCVTDMYVRGLTQGILMSGLIKEIRGLLK